MKTPASVLLGTSLIVASSLGAAPKDQTASERAQDGNPCAQYGEGYQQIPGTDTCVKVSGSFQATSSFGSGSAKPSH